MNTDLYNEIQQGVVSVSESNDLKEALSSLNEDVVDADGFTSIDTRTRIAQTQVSALAALDILTRVGVFPQKYNRIGRSMKRLSISASGHGRTEMVNVVRGIQEQKQQEKSVAERVNTNDK